MSWLGRLARELAEAQQRDITEATLRAEIEQFIDDCQDPYLRDSYPNDIHHLGAGRPQAKTVDLILSFMDAVYGRFSSPTIRELADRLAASSRPDESQLAKVLRRERKRRWVNPRSTSEDDLSYWGRTHRRVVEKYAGLYALVRRGSDLSLRIEPFALAPRTDDPTTVAAFWHCRDRLRVGDLLVNTYRFSGLMVLRSTDEVIDPTSMTFLRAPRTTGEKRPGHEKPPVIMGGFMVGWKEGEPHRLFQSRLALIKLPLSAIRLDTEEAFMAAKEDDRVKDRLGDLARHPSVSGTLVEAFLESDSPEMGHLDARNALPGLFRE